MFTILSLGCTTLPELPWGKKAMSSSIPAQLQEIRLSKSKPYIYVLEGGSVGGWY